MASGERNYWLGGASTGLPTDWEVDDNWSLRSIPVDGEDVVVPASSKWSILQNVDRTGDTGLAGLDLASFTVERGSDIQIGQYGAPMKFSVSSGVILFGGDGDVFYNPATGSAEDDTDSIVVDGGNVTICVEDNTGSGVNVFSVAALSGHLSLSTDFAGANTGRVVFLSVGRRGQASPGPTVETTGDSHINFVVVSGGDVTLGHTTTDKMYVSGGIVTVTRDDLGRFTAIHAYITGGRINWMGGLSSSMGLVNMYAMGGILDLNASPTDKLLDVLVIHPGATVLHNRAWVTIDAYRDFGLDLFRSPSVSGTINTWLSVNTNWEDEDNWDQGHIPADDEHVVVPGDATTSLLLNMDRTGQGTGLRLASLTIHDDCTVDVGDADNPLKCTISGRAIHRGNGTLYFNPKEGSASENTTEVIIDSPNSNDAAVINVDTANNVLQWLEVLRGRVIATTADLGTIVIKSIQVSGTGHVTVTAESRVEELMQSDGTTLFSGQTLSREFCSGGRVSMLRDDLTSLAGLGTTRHFISRRGLLEWRGAMAEAKTPTVHAMGGVVDFNRTSASKTIDTLFVHPNAKVKANRPWIRFDDTYDFGLETRSGS